MYVLRSVTWFYTCFYRSLLTPYNSAVTRSKNNSDISVVWFAVTLFYSRHRSTISLLYTCSASIKMQLYVHVWWNLPICHRSTGALLCDEALYCWWVSMLSVRWWYNLYYAYRTDSHTEGAVCESALITRYTFFIFNMKFFFMHLRVFLSVLCNL